MSNEHTIIANAISADLALVAIQIMTECNNITVKECHEDQTDIEDFYYEEVKLYCRIHGECRVIRIINKKDKVIIGLTDKHKPWTYSDWTTEELIEYINNNP